jgi:homoserine O-acetyltransferase
MPQEMEEIRDTMISINSEDILTYKEIQSDYGHDAFLVEIDKFGNYVKKLLEK